MILVVLLALGLAGFATPARAMSAPAATASISPATTLTLSFTCATAYDYSYGKVCVHTLPYAALTIKVKYCTGYYAVSYSLKGTHYANSSGNYTWSWTPETKCRGWAHAYVTASKSGQTVYATDTFYVH